MGRWESNAQGRLENAALVLYMERGFHQTTAQEIAERAGLTERTFFRHFADKREVLFYGSHDFRQLVISRVEARLNSESPFGAVMGAFADVSVDFDDRRESVIRRQAVIDSTPELEERDLKKMASVAASITDLLRSRDVEDLAAILVAEAGVAVFRSAFGVWLSATDDVAFADHIQRATHELAHIIDPSTVGTS